MERINIIKSMQNRKPPGLYGFPTELKVFCLKSSVTVSGLRSEVIVQSNVYV